MSEENQSEGQTWCDHCSADLDSVRHILCERCYREYAGPKWFDPAFAGASDPTVTADHVNAAAEAIAKRYTVGKGGIAVIAAIITRHLAAPFRAPDVIAQQIVGTVFDNTGASHETLKQTMLERITDWFVTTTSPETPVGGEVQERTTSKICTRAFPCRYRDPRQCARDTALGSECPKVCECVCHADALSENERINSSWEAGKHVIGCDRWVQYDEHHAKYDNSIKCTCAAALRTQEGGAETGD